MKRAWFALLVPFSIILTGWAHRNPQATERWFSEGFYRFWAAVYGRVFGYLPFSVSQFLIIIVPVGAVAYIFYEIYCIFVRPQLRKRKEAKAVNPKDPLEFGKWENEYNGWARSYRKKCIGRLLANSTCVVGILWFLFTIGAGLNYARLELGEVLGLEVRPSTVAELAALTEILVAQANELSTQVARDENGVMVISAPGYVALSRQAREIFRNAGEDIPILRGFVPHAKPIVYSRFMSRLGIVGIYSPFTLEAHVNVDVLDYHIPNTMLHELAHFRGIMREDEANFIAWLVGKRSGNPDFMYSGAMLALTHASGQLWRVSRDAHNRVMAAQNAYVLADRRANWYYWRQFDGPLTEISQNINDAYLRAQRQEDGVQSYGRMVDLLLAYFRAN